MRKASQKKNISVTIDVALWLSRFDGTQWEQVNRIQRIMFLRRDVKLKVMVSRSSGRTVSRNTPEHAQPKPFDLSNASSILPVEERQTLHYEDASSGHVHRTRTHLFLCFARSFLRTFFSLFPIFFKYYSLFLSLIHLTIAAAALNAACVLGVCEQQQQQKSKSKS